MASQKGGSGKTTLSGHLAVQAQRAGAGPVVLIDIDPQGSLADWWNEREAEYPAFAQTTVSRLANDLQVLRQQGFKLAVIDTPPAITMAIQSVIQVAELVIIPTRPGDDAPLALAAAFPAYVAGRHVYIQSLPAGSVPSCGASLDYMMDVLPLHEVIPVDLFLPGCPPSAERIRAAIEPLLHGQPPRMEGASMLRFG